MKRSGLFLFSPTAAVWLDTLMGLTCTRFLVRAELSGGVDGCSKREAKTSQTIPGEGELENTLPKDRRRPGSPLSHSKWRGGCVE